MRQYTQIVHVVKIMGKEFTIQYITGTPEYNVYVCDNSGINCVYIDTINNFDIPYTKEIPAPYNSMSNFSIKIIDINGCEILKNF